MSAFVVVTTNNKPSIFGAAWSYEVLPSGVLRVEKEGEAITKFYGPGAWRTITEDPIHDEIAASPIDETNVGDLPELSVFELDD